MTIRNELTIEPKKRSFAEVTRDRAADMHASICADLAETPGGQCGPVAALLARLAAEDLFLRGLFLSLGDYELARKHGASARDHLLGALKAAATESAARRVQ